MPFERRPAALVEEVAGLDGVRLLGVHDDEVGPVAFADEAAAFDAEEHGGGVAGALDGGLEREGALRDEVQEHLERVLHERQAGRGLEVGLRLLFAGVRSVVGRDHVDDAGSHGGADRGPVGGRLDRRVAFDLVAEAGVILFGEPEMVHAGFGRQALALERRGAEQRELFGGGDVQDVQARVVTAGQFGGHRRGSVAGFGVADTRVFAGGDVFAPLGLGGGFGGLDAGGVLAVRGDEGGGVAEDAFQRSGCVDEHVAGRGAHEDLHAADLAGVGRLDRVEVGVGRAEEEGVVGDRRRRADGELLFEFLVVGGRRVRVRHLHERGHSAGHGRAGFAGDTGLVGQPGFAEVHLVVDQPGQQQLARQVVFLVGDRAGRDRSDTLDASGT